MRVTVVHSSRTAQYQDNLFEDTVQNSLKYKPLSLAVSITHNLHSSVYEKSRKSSCLTLFLSQTALGISL